jgi:hypothetical protein
MKHFFRAPISEKSGKKKSSSFLQVGTKKSSFKQSALQTALGNRGVQAKLKLSNPSDPYEREADRVADRVVNQHSASSPIKSSGDAQVQRSCQQCQEDELVQRKSHHSSPSSDSGFSASSELHGGKSMAAQHRSYYESAFGHDFSQVKVFTGADAHDSAQSISAKAYTQGTNIVFAKGEYQPDTQQGKKLLAHELTHVVQQRDMIQRFTTEDCPQDAIDIISETIPRSIAMLEYAIEKLNEDPVNATVQRHFANHFGAYAGWRNYIARSKLEAVLSIMQGGEIDYECEEDCSDAPSTVAYVLAPSILGGDVHLCLPWLRSESLNERAESFIHELFHWSLGMVDLGDYHKNNEDNDTSWPIAVSTPDAYSEFVQDVYEHR